MSFSASVAALVEASQAPLVQCAACWPRVELGSVARILNGFPFKSEYFSLSEGEPLIRIRDVTSGRTDTKYFGPRVDGYWVDAGELVVGMDGDFNSRLWSADRALLNQRVCKITPDERFLDLRFLAYLLPGYLALVNDETHSVTVKHLSSKTIQELPLPLPPLPEQRRIVAKLDAMTARMARARADLDRVPVLAERQRQAALAAAFSGRLTKSWRDDGEYELPTGDQLLTALAAHRGSLNEGRKAARRGPIADPEAGRQPLAIDTIPPSWAVADLERITDPRRLIQYGILKPGDHREGGVPYVKVMNIRGGRIELDRIRKTTPEIHAAYRRSALKAGDLLLTIRGTVGRVGFVPPELDGGNITQDSVRIAVLPGIEARLVYWFLQSPAAQEYFRANQKGVAVRGINVGDVRPMEIPIPPLDEQREIVRRLDHAFVEIDRLLAQAAAARRLLDRLDQAILAKAFRGELVPQDPADEPVSVLLDRIRTERAGSDAKVRRRHHPMPTI